EFRNKADVLIWTSHGDTETQRRSTRAARTAGRAVRRANRKRTTEPRSSGRSFAVCTPRPPLGGAASSALPAACSSLCLCVLCGQICRRISRRSFVTNRRQNRPSNAQGSGLRAQGAGLRAQGSRLKAQSEHCILNSAISPRDSREQRSVSGSVVGRSAIRMEKRGAAPWLHAA